MNYIKEINAFYDLMLQTPLSASAISLWHALIHMNNKTRWKNEFTAASVMLQYIAGLTESSFKRARKELVEQGYIEVESRGRGKAPIYKMKSLALKIEEHVHFESEELLAEPQPLLPDRDEQAVQYQHEYYLKDRYENVQNIKMEHAGNCWNQNDFQNVKPKQLEKTVSKFNEEKLGQRLDPSFTNQDNHTFGSLLTPETNLVTSYHQKMSKASVEPKQNTVLNHESSYHFNHGLNHMDPAAVIQHVDHATDELNQLSAQHSNPSPAMSLVMDQPMNHVVPQLANHLPNQHPAPLYKQNIYNTKQNNTNKFVVDDARASVFADQNFDTKFNEPDAILFYQQNFGTAGPFVMESLFDYIQNLGDELVIEAMKRALDRNKTSWGYVKSILNSWYKKGIRTLDQAHAEQIDFKNNHKQRKGGSVGIFGDKNEVVPEWFYEQKKNRTEREQKAKKKQATLEDLAKVKQEYLQGKKKIRKVV